MSSTTYLKHQFLLSMPQLESDYFSSSLIYLCEHNEEGAMGIVVNKPSDTFMDEVFEQLDLPQRSYIRSEIIYQGGPVMEDRGFVLHPRSEQRWKSSLELPDDLSLSTSLDIVEAIAAGTGPQEFLFALGYAGWGPGQLEEELGNNVWLSSPANLDIIFRTEPEARLSAAAADLGIDFNLISAQAGHA